MRWLKALRRRRQRVSFANTMANNYNGTDDCDLAGLWMTFAHRQKKKLFC